jgi:IS4 transposase
MRQGLLNILELLSQHFDVVRLGIGTALFALLILIVLYHRATFGAELL